MTHSNGREREKRNVDFMDSSCVFSVLILQSFRKSWKVERAAKKLLSRDLTVHELRIIDKHSNVVAVSVNVERKLSFVDNHTSIFFPSFLSCSHCCMPQQYFVLNVHLSMN